MRPDDLVQAIVSPDALLAAPLAWKRHCAHQPAFSQHSDATPIPGPRHKLK